MGGKALTSPEQELFSARLASLYDEVAASDVQGRLRANAWQQFLRTGLPGRKNESYQLVRLRQLYAGDYRAPHEAHLGDEAIARHLLPGHAHIVLINGTFHSTTLPEAIPFSQAVRSYATFLKNRFERSVASERDPFALLNSALHQEGVFFYLPPGREVEQPIQILHLVDSEEARTFLPRIQLFAGAHAKAELVVTTVATSGSDLFLNQLIDVALEEGANISVRRQEENLADSWLLESVRVTQKRSSRFALSGFSRGIKTHRQDIRVALQGEEAEVDLRGGSMLAGSAQSHNHILVEHMAPHCRSSQLYKAVLDDSSKSSFEGCIYVAPEAQKTDAFQLNKNLLLSDRASATAKPGLEIFADDVKASHGATTGQFDPDELFYLRSRGLDLATARKLLVDAFLVDVR